MRHLRRWPQTHTMCSKNGANHGPDSKPSTRFDGRFRPPRPCTDYSTDQRTMVKSPRRIIESIFSSGYLVLFALFLAALPLACFQDFDQFRTDQVDTGAPPDDSAADTLEDGEETSDEPDTQVDTEEGDEWNWSRTRLSSRHGWSGWRDPRRPASPWW